MKKLLISASVVLLLLCSFALVVSAEDCAHKDNWELKFGEADILGYWEAINVCPDCGLVLKDEFCEPLITSRGYSFYVDSFSQSFYLNRKMIEKYEGYTGEKLNFGLVAGVTEQIGFNPVNSDGTLANENGILSSFAESEFNIIDIKITNLPSDSYNTKVTACMFIIRGGDVIYIDGSKFGEKMTGVSHSGIVDAIENGETPTGIEYNSEYRKLTANEMEILFACYWQSDNTEGEYAIRRTTENTYQKFASTRMFTRDELPSGSYVIIPEGWSVRPEIWKTDASGKVIKNSGTDRPTPIDKKGKYAIEDFWRDNETTTSDYKYMAFNVSESKGTYFDQGMMTPEGIAGVLQIYVPANTKVATNTYEKTNDVSVEGLKLVEWQDGDLKKGSYWYNTNSTKVQSGNNNFCATPKFTPETLPVGSVIEINEGWIYRAEFWTDIDKTAKPRGPLVSTYRVLVTEDFWNGIAAKGFNLSRAESGSLSGYDIDVLESAIKIYVPVN